LGYPDIRQVWGGGGNGHPQPNPHPLAGIRQRIVDYPQPALLSNDAIVLKVVHDVGFLDLKANLENRCFEKSKQIQANLYKHIPLGEQNWLCGYKGQLQAKVHIWWAQMSMWNGGLFPYG
jgi:hypothetical protein